ncbi:MAG: polyprenyl synthetase family protein [Clostridiales bacterium]|nr:polyprenyl synthetase family protein [Clostridiales bacterium]
MTPETRLIEYKKLIDNELTTLFSETDEKQSLLFDAMKYSIGAGGKRIRPILVLEFTRISGGETRHALPFALAVELIHTYSLIHDDLPCMDNDDLRRDKPTNHKVYGEAVAVLAGDALLNMAFEIILDSKVNIPEKRALDAARVLSRASGAHGMIGGQILDMISESNKPGFDDVTLIHKLKTGALISAACETGCIVSGADKTLSDSAKSYGELLGLAFQIKDDFLSYEGKTEKTGKTAGIDKERGKTTLIDIIGPSGSKKLLVELTESALSKLSAFHDTEFLIYLTNLLSVRDY